MARPSTYQIHPTEHVLKILKESLKPMSAYHLLNRLNVVGITAPPVVYRALDSLVKQRKIHKVKELSAFIACNCDETHTHDVSVLTICQKCHSVNEIHDDVILNQFYRLKQQGINLTDNALIELPIICELCHTR
jgi:Fur family transcriptional regulator, zinc uptake regulator